MLSPKKVNTTHTFNKDQTYPKPTSASRQQPTLGRGIKTLSMSAATVSVPSYEIPSLPLNGTISSPTSTSAVRSKVLKTTTATNRTKSNINSPTPIRRTRSKILGTTTTTTTTTTTSQGLVVSAPTTPSHGIISPPSPSQQINATTNAISPKKILTVNTNTPSAPPSPSNGSNFSQPVDYSSGPASPIASASPTARRMKSHQSRIAAFPSQSSAASTSSPTSTYPSSISSPTSQQTSHKRGIAPRKLDTSLDETTSSTVQPSPKTTLFSPLYKLHDEDGKEIKLDGESKRGSTGNIQPKVKAIRKDKKADAQAAREVEAAQVVAQQVYQHQHAHHHHIHYDTTQTQPDPQHTVQVATVSYTPVLEEDDFDPFLFIKNLPPLSPAVRNRRSPLPKKLKSSPRISLALDLDETLVHCSVQPIEKAELTFSVSFNGLDYEVYVRTRPHLKEFLETVSQWFEIIVFTASQKVYADKLLNILDPHSKYIQHRVFRDSCVCIDGNYLKDLTILGRELPTVAIVDNSVQAFGFQLDNGIPIESWFDDDTDRELLNLLPFLQNLKEAKDVRPIIRDTFRLQEFVNSL